MCTDIIQRVTYSNVTYQLSPPSAGNNLRALSLSKPFSLSISADLCGGRVALFPVLFLGLFYGESASAVSVLLCDYNVQSSHVNGPRSNIEEGCEGRRR